MIISGGENIYPSEVENLLGGHPAVKGVAVIGVPHHRWGEAVHTVVVRHGTSSATEQEILEWCKGPHRRLQAAGSLAFIDDSDMPRKATGEILHRTLRDRYIPQGDLGI